MDKVDSHKSIERGVFTDKGKVFVASSVTDFSGKRSIHELERIMRNNAHREDVAELLQTA